jgi:hypothetical protein
MKVDICKFCGEKVNLNEEGNTHRDGTVSHEACSDGDTFSRENAIDADGVHTMTTGFWGKGEY